jgi:hypothetical protein
MKVQIKRLVGKTELFFEVDVKEKMEFFRSVSFIDLLPSKCGNCGSDNLAITYRAPKGYEYAQVRCVDCKHELKFHQKKEEDEMYLVESEGWQPPYQGDSAQEEETQEAPARPAGFGRTAVPAAAPKAAPAKAPVAKTSSPMSNLRKPAAPAAPKAAPAPAQEPEVVDETPADAQEVPPAPAPRLSAPKTTTLPPKTTATSAPTPTPPQVAPNLDDRVQSLKNKYGIPSNLSNLRR